MPKLRCQDCGRITEGKNSDVDESSCDGDGKDNECGGSFAILNSEDDEYEPQLCAGCKKEIFDVDNNSWTCDECDEEPFCKDCIVLFEEANCSYCNSCTDKARGSNPKVETKIVEKIVERIVEKPIYLTKEGIPIDTSFNPNQKTKFD